MNVLMLNGSPHENGCTATALSEVASALRQEGVDSEIVWLGKKPIRDCTACGACQKLDSQCVFGDDLVNEVCKKARAADGFIFGTPVYYAHPSGAVLSFLDRLFYAADAEVFAHKPGAAVASARRAGTTASLDVLNKYFTIAQMPIVSSQYWNMVHGNTPEQVRQDLEGLQIMRTLGKNMAWMLKCIEAGKKSGILPPEDEPRQRTNFIR